MQYMMTVKAAHLTRKLRIDRLKETAPLGMTWMPAHVATGEMDEIAAGWLGYRSKTTGIAIITRNVQESVKMIAHWHSRLEQRLSRLTQSITWCVTQRKAERETSACNS
jgi:hypothetical protein